jgi:hypothetical protein
VAASGVKACGLRTIGNFRNGSTGRVAVSSLARCSTDPSGQRHAPPARPVAFVTAGCEAARLPVLAGYDVPETALDEACQARHWVLFATAAVWVARLADARAAGRLQAELIRLGRYPLIVVDEVGVHMGHRLDASG